MQKRQAQKLEIFIERDREIARQRKQDRQLKALILRDKALSKVLLTGKPLREVITKEDYEKLLAGRKCILWINLPGGKRKCVEWKD